MLREVVRRDLVKLAGRVTLIFVARPWGGATVVNGIPWALPRGEYASITIESRKVLATVRP
jgi:hypothetical protein